MPAGDQRFAGAVTRTTDFVNQISAPPSIKKNSGRAIRHSFRHCFVSLPHDFQHWRCL
jgi:hypothetical protein